MISSTTPYLRVLSLMTFTNSLPVCKCHQRQYWQVWTKPRLDRDLNTDKHVLVLWQTVKTLLIYCIMPHYIRVRTVCLQIKVRLFSSLQLNHSRRIVVIHKQKYVHEVQVNCLFKLAQEKVWLGELTVLP